MSQSEWSSLCPWQSAQALGHAEGAVFYGEEAVPVSGHGFVDHHTRCRLFRVHGRYVQVIDYTISLPQLIQISVSSPVYVNLFNPWEKSCTSSEACSYQLSDLNLIAVDTAGIAQTFDINPEVGSCVALYPAGGQLQFRSVDCQIELGVLCDSTEQCSTEFCTEG